MKKSIFIAFIVFTAVTALFAQDPAPSPSATTTPIPAKVILRSETDPSTNRERYYLEATPSPDSPSKPAAVGDLECSGNVGTQCDPKGAMIGGVFKSSVYQAPAGYFRGLPLYRPIILNRCNGPCDDPNIFRIYLSDDPNIPAEVGKYNVVFFSYPTASEKDSDKNPDGPPTSPWQATASIPIKRSIGNKVTFCGDDPAAIGFLFQAAKPVAGWTRDIQNWFTRLSSSPGDLVLRTNAASSGNVEITPVSKVVLVQHPPDDSTVDRISICLQMAKDLPRETYNAYIVYNGPNRPPLEVVSPARVDKIEGVARAATEPALADGGTVGERKLDKNLDFAFTFSTERVTKTENNINRVERDTRGVFDLRLIPKIFESDDDDEQDDPQTYWAVQPFFIDAKVATGKIEKSTISLNRVALGTDVEFRYITESARPSTYYRFNFRGINASDRDFKIIEGKFNFEFRPVAYFLNRPLKSDGEPKNVQLAPDGTNPMPPPDHKFIFDGWGFSLVPTFGFEFGKTYRNHRPAAGIVEKPKVFRGIFGFSLVLNPRDWITFTMEDKFFSRSSWEKGDRGINYFKTTLDLALSKKFNVPQSIVFSYENGKQPPFTDEVVNTFKIGYRIQTNWRWPL